MVNGVVEETPQWGEGGRWSILSLYIIITIITGILITALLNGINQLYIPALDHLDPTSQTVITHILLHGLNLPSIDCNINKNINLEIFAIFSSYISQTARFVKIL